ncbi:zinc finger CCCH domain-containing protein 39-like isoform X2 [Chenopodium quinoa]|uniref:zinc finger CCCH domain-containing protein 39-like isoform X2 n=1 Tax=Chenopodium quinoa TaxID=63459 RepID=UPI000B77E049|nr:zinc finger CCCH domain-containing protein 39-like isoform X2 [Chenopodium quinoa]
MSFSDSFSSFVPFSNGLDSMGFWPQFNGSNEQPEVNSEFDHDLPPLKRSKSSSDNLPSNLTHRTPQMNPPVNQPTGKIFFKTRLCAKFRMGQCRNGENCNFAHGEDDLRKPPPNWQELVGGRTEDRGNSGSDNWEDDDRIIHKMKLCKKFYNGEECPYGDRCNFLHKEPAKFREPAPVRFRENSRESSAISIGTTGPPMVQQQQSRVPDQYDVHRMVVASGNGNGNVNGGMDVMRGNSRPVYWKTKRCTKFETTGQCPFGDNCHFAHGQSELLLPGGRPADAEPVTMNSAPLKPVSAPINDPTPTKIDIGVPSGHEGQGKKCLFKWKGTKKINRIYGDWIDDLPLNLPNQVES